MKHFEEIQDLSNRLKRVEERMADFLKFDGINKEASTGEIAPLLSQVERSYYWLNEARRRYIINCIKRAVGGQLELELDDLNTGLSKYEIIKTP